MNLSLDGFNKISLPAPINFWFPKELPDRMYILRMLIKKPGGRFQLPLYLYWLDKLFIDEKPDWFVYLTKQKNPLSSPQRGLS